MPLIASISGIRGVVGDGLTPEVLVRYASAFGAWCRSQSPTQREGEHAKPTVVVGRDGRTTGDLCSRIVTATLQAAGCDVVDAGLATTPTVEMAVPKVGAAGAVILSASHNPEQWNALKLLNSAGEFLSPAEADQVLALADLTLDSDVTHAVAYEHVGSYRQEDFLDDHLDQILALDFIDPDAIAAKGFAVVVDGINSVGGFAIPALLERLGVTDVTVLNGEPTGRFAHNPEPLPAHLTQITSAVAERGADLGVVVDPDADRLAFVADGGAFFGEELTQVLAADFLMRKTPGPFATNLSSSRAIEDVMVGFGHPVHRSKVGEVNVVGVMKEVGAVLGGEGNGGVILPALHYGRDALVGVAMALQHLAETGEALSAIKARFPSYVIAKHKLPLDGLGDPHALLDALAARYADRDDARLSTLDGVKLDLAEGWVHLRPSNTEPIVRVYAEAESQEAADALAIRFKQELMGQK
ncbi:MAG: phosphoglucosamine mutase [Bacteroidota bacterium]